MASSLPPSRLPHPAHALAMAEAALQRQNVLQDALGAKSGVPADAPAPAPFPAVPDAPARPATAHVPPPPAPPPGADRVSLSAQARAGLPLASHPAAQPAAPPGTASGGALALASSLAPQPTGPGGGAPAPGAQALPAQWPAGGVGAQQEQLLQGLVRQIALPAGTPAQLVAAQPWSPAMAQLFEGGRPAPLPALHTWAVGQGVVHTPQGPRGFAFTLQVPMAAMQGAQAPPALPRGLAVAFSGPMQALASGLFALVLQPAGGGTRTSALLTLDFSPLPAPQAAVYGREQLQPRADPWLQMAALQASGQGRDRVREDDGEGAPECATPGCPYEGRARCAQPFCLALRVRTLAGAPPA